MQGGVERSKGILNYKYNNNRAWNKINSKAGTCIYGGH